MSFNLKMDAVDLFFDREKVIDRAGRDTARRLSKAGAFVRRRARSKLRRRKRTSAPGEPPSVHSKNRIASIKNILFALQTDDEAVVIGPVALNQSNLVSSAPGVTIPGLLELGGTATIQEERWIGSEKWRRRDLRRLTSPRKEYRSRRARYAARPFMGPSLEEEVAAGTIINLWRRR